MPSRQPRIRRNPLLKSSGSSVSAVPQAEADWAIRRGIWTGLSLYMETMAYGDRALVALDEHFPAYRCLACGGRLGIAAFTYKCFYQSDLLFKHCYSRSCRDMH